MRIRQIGEFGLIERIARRLEPGGDVVVGPGDDCAVVKFDSRHYQLLTCDMLVEGVDFTAGDDPRLIGRKAIAVSLSDIAACAGLPKQCLVSLGLPRNSPVAFIDKLTAGMLAVCRKYGVSLVGGDLSRSEKIVIDVSMTGLVGKKRLALRGGARAGDMLFVTGALGGSRAGKQFNFTPRVREAQLLTRACAVHAMIDISDGLAQDLGHILAASSAGAVLYESLIPLSANARGVDSALYDGEDFELLFAVSRANARKLIKSYLKYFKPVGEVTDKSRGLRLVDRKNKERPIPARGYRHF